MLPVGAHSLLLGGLKLLKICLLITSLRLLSTAFNWEFGISRQYLRLLEWLFQVGQQRIERVESDKRLHGNHLEDVSRTNEQPPDTNGPMVKDQQVLSQEQASSETNASETDASDTDASEAKGQGPAPVVASSRRKHLKPLASRPKLLSFSANESAQASLASHSTSGSTRRRLSRILDPPEFEGIQPLVSSSKPTLSLAARLIDDSAVGRQASDFQQQQRRRRISSPDGPPVFLLDDFEDLNASQKHEFQWLDAAQLVVRGIGSIMDDQVTKRFTPEQLEGWNLLTRTNARNYQFMSRSLGLCWLAGLMIRYTLLLPLRILFTLAGFVWLTGTMSLIGLLPPSWRLPPYKLMSLMSFRMLSCGITSRLRFHNRQYRAQMGDICVANHTSPLDVVLLACDNCYALVGQRHWGLLGLLEWALSRATRHVWFDRAQMRDRQLVTRRLRDHLISKSNLPVLIFPEGTCINNSAVMMFRKGAFETTDRVCPVALKYDARFGDPFWNSAQQSYVQYLLLMMSSWAIKCDVWYLPPMDRLQGESSAEFAQRVKSEIAKQGGLVDLAWDGQLKRSSIKPTWLHQQQEDYVQRLKLD